MLDEDGFEYISSKAAKEMISTLPHIFENVVVFTEFAKDTGLKYLVVRSNRGYANFFYAYISDRESTNVIEEFKSSNDIKSDDMG